MNYFPLPDHRNRFSFALGTTSYIYDEPRDNIIYNIQRLQYAVDFVQLCLFGKNYIDDFLSPTILAALKQASTQQHLEYVVHLPMDYTFLNCARHKVAEGLDHIEMIMVRLKEISVRAYVLHVDNYRFESTPPLLIEKHVIDRFQYVLEQLQERFAPLAGRIHIENTAYDLTAMAPVLNSSRLGVCLDVGHLIMLGLPIQRFIDTYGNRIGSAHLHGVEKGVDHRSLTFLDEGQRKAVVDFLSTFRGLVVVEVFNLKDLLPSMLWLAAQITNQKERNHQK
jgi:sugar phosphate isomerase/epimerase